MSRAARQPLQPGTQLGGYTLERVLGEGGMGVVWEAHDPDLDRAIAVKVLRHEEAGVALRRRLLREARAMARLKHPNVLVVYEVGSDGDRDFIAMELVEGSSLDTWLAQEPRPERGEVFAALLGAGRGLAAAHEAGLVHRDFKPHNVLRQRDGRVVVSDFGLARGVEDRGEAGVAPGVPPELASAPPPDAAARDPRRGIAHDVTLEASDGAPAGALPATPATGAAAEQPVDATAELPATPATGAAAEQPVDATAELPATPATGAKSPSASGKRRDDSVLDSTLTQTGAMLGTPAYMAPEQFAGAAPDPRTDQFAYCVTAWQALTGERPFRGASLDELRAAASKGAPSTGGEALGRAVRNVLARGLHPEPDKRWPDMPALLAALERAQRRPRDLALGAVAALVATTAVAFALAQGRRGDDAGAVIETVRAKSPCAPGEPEIARAWRPEIRDAQVKRLGKLEGLTRLADQLDAYRADWLRRYDAACAVPEDRAFHSRIGCLLGQRDELEAFTLLVDHAPKELFLGSLPYGLIPNLAVCASETPYAPPSLPADPQRRAAIQAMRARLLELRSSVERVDGQASSLIAEAELAGWEPIAAEVCEATGIAAHLLGKVEVARERLDKAISYADRSKHERVAANARIARLEIETQRASDPTSARGLDLAVEDVRTAIQRAGGDRHLVAVLDLLRANIVEERGGLWEGAILANGARKTFLELGDKERAVRAFERVADGLDRVPTPTEQVAFDEMIAAMDGALPGDPRVHRAAARIAWWRGRLADVHARLDRANLGAAPVHDARLVVGRVERTIVKGRVVGADGKPRANALVVTWTGELWGDARRVYGDPADVAASRGEIAHTASDGTFEMKAPVGAAVIAEAGADRSVPRALPDGAAWVELRLEPTRTLAVPQVSGEAFVRFTAGDARWHVAAAVDTHRDVNEVAGVPPGGEAGLRTGAGLRASDRRLATGQPADKGFAGLVAATREGHDRTLEVVVRPGRGAGEDVWVFGGRVEPRTLAELRALARDAPRVATTSLGAIGAAATDEGRRVYQRDDAHAVLRDLRMPEYTACVVRQPVRPEATVACAVGRTTRPDDAVEAEVVVVVIPVADSRVTPRP